ncbi:MAG: M20 family metallopeptidase [Candidatus Bathyarchaeota archaeon]|jgi:amidohydrolase|nr:M20 family metallopeptidase [Candidatus Bathyarchaeota archaeon]
MPSWDVALTKRLVSERIEVLKPKILQISHFIFENPELGLSEFKASELLSTELRRHGFSVEMGVAGLPTAFKASKGKTGEPAIGLIAEYDALAALGHACGHNIIAASAVGAALGLAEFLEETRGRLVVFGTPNEEGSTAEGKGLIEPESQVRGKVKMVEAGCFNDIDAAMMIHPYVKTTLTPEFLALTPLRIAFKGKPAHAAAAPEKGINALDAVILTFNAINALRQHIRSDVRIHGIVTEGGEAPNIVPEKASALFYLRASDKKYLDEVLKRVKGCAEGSALATGATLDFRPSPYSLANMLTNSVLCRIFEKNLGELGETVDQMEKHEHLGSSDIGNVSQIIPTIHPLVAVGPRNLAIHSHEFAKAAISESGDRALILAAKAMAFTCVDLFADREIFSQMRKELHASV